MKPDAAAAFRAAAEVPDRDDAEARRQECPVCGATCRTNPKTGAMPPHHRLGGAKWCTYAGKRPLTAEEREAADARERGPSDADIVEAHAAQARAETAQAVSYAPNADDATAALREALERAESCACDMVTAAFFYRKAIGTEDEARVRSEFHASVQRRWNDALAAAKAAEHDLATARAHAVLSGESAT